MNAWEIEQAKAQAPFIEALLDINPTAASVLHSTGVLPLHYMVSSRCQHGTARNVALLLKCYPDAIRIATPTQMLPRADVFGPGLLPLHLAISSNQTKPEVVALLLDQYPGAAAVASEDGHLPLHAAIEARLSHSIIIKLLDMYPAGVYELPAGNTRLSQETVTLLKQLENRIRHQQRREAELPVDASSVIRTPSQRLIELQDLLNTELITPEEHHAKRLEIIKDI